VNTRAVAYDSVLEPSGRPRLPARALAFLVLLAIAAIACVAPFLEKLLSGEAKGWTTFALLAGASAVSHVFLVKAPGRRAYHSSIIFLVAASLLVRPELLILLGLLTNLPEWLKERPAWYIQAFNITNYTLNTMAAWGAAELVRQSGFVHGNTQWALAGLSACVVFVALNHLLLPLMLRLARGTSFRDGGLFDVEWHSTDLVLAALGVALATFWDGNPWLVPVALAPLLVVHRSFSVPQLQAEARVDAKTGLFNARHFATVLNDELGRAQRFERPMSLVVADLDLLRDINNTYGHLAGDAVLTGIAEIFRRHLRHYDVPARFGGEEFCILLPETEPEQALQIAERIRQAVAAAEFEVETSSEPIHATISMGVASFPRDGQDSNQIIHEADLAVYRAKLQGRNRVLDASSEPLAVPADRSARLIAVPEEGPHDTPLPPAPEVKPDSERRHPRPHSVAGPRFLSLSWQLVSVVTAVGSLGILAGVLGAIFGTSTDIQGLIAVTVLVAAGQALALETDFDGSISVGAVGSLAGAAIFGPRAALVLAVATVAIDWSARRQPFHQVFFNVGALCLASLASAAVFGAGSMANFAESVDALIMAAAGVVAGVAYFAVNTGLVAIAESVATRDRLLRAWNERFAWLITHYLAYGLIGGVILIGYRSAHLYALAVFAVPLLLMRKTQEAYLRHTQKSAQKLREAAETIQSQNVSLEHANRLLKERTTAAMESLSATVDARDAYTAGHSRRVQRLSLAIGRELGLSQAELDLLGHAALFHDIGKLAIPDAILLKPAKLTDEEWVLMQSHAEEGARIIERLGFLNDAVPAIRHHHERFDGRGYPEGIKGEDIPLGARIIHVADALDSMLTVRIYRAARPMADALAELKELSGKQFCPRCVAALDRVLPQVAREDEQSSRVEQLLRVAS
jgi:diguanylate cyclase (GGDEF)-like protein/putative nucleotidyltransferase with HDIG domain